MDLLQQAVVIVFKLRLGLHGSLDQKFNVSELAEVKVALALQTLYRLFQGVVLLLQRCVHGIAAAERSACSGTTDGRGCTGAAGSCGGGSGAWRAGWGCACALSSGYGIVVAS